MMIPAAIPSARPRQTLRDDKGLAMSGRYNDRLPEPSRKHAMEAEHVNAIANALAGLKDRTAQLRRYL
jgi:pantothenate synthetase